MTSKPLTQSADDQQPPISAAEALRMKGRKASGKLSPALADKLMADPPPAMEEIDGRRYPKGAEGVLVPALKAGELSRGGATETDAYIPEHADLAFKPPLEPRAMRKPMFINRAEFVVALAGQLGQPVAPVRDLGGARTIFGADNRRVYYSTAYPWRCVGKVETPLGSGSGTMVGPRHLLTCSHVIDWHANGGAGWIKFTPMFYNGSAPYGSGWGTRVYSKKKVTGPTIDSTEGKYDYVVVVLDRTLGQATGWMGTKTYHDSWDGGAYWTHAGYPGDLTGGQRPTYQTSIALDGDFWTPDSHQRIEHQGDVWPGQSGGPFWGYWDGSPYAVAAQSGQTAQRNSASGGSDLVDLVIRARNEHP
jgi:V8-like Glu-specific endopeptidase